MKASSIKPFYFHLSSQNQGQSNCTIAEHCARQVVDAEHHRRQQRLIQRKSINCRDPSASLEESWTQAPHSSAPDPLSIQNRALQNRGSSKQRRVHPRDDFGLPCSTFAADNSAAGGHRISARSRLKSCEERADRGRSIA